MAACTLDRLTQLVKPETAAGAWQNKPTFPHDEHQTISDRLRSDSELCLDQFRRLLVPTLPTRKWTESCNSTPEASPNEDYRMMDRMERQIRSGNTRFRDLLTPDTPMRSPILGFGGRGDYTKQSARSLSGCDHDRCFNYR